MTTYTSPRVTVITPTYNRADYLPETIESVLAQDYLNLEYVVLDDGSTDNTQEVLRQYEGRLTWHTHPNMGESKTVNRGLQLAQGEIIGVVNSDDPILPGLVTAAVAALEADPALLVVYPDWDMIDAESKPFDHVQVYDYDYDNMLRWHHCFPGPGAFFRRRAVELEHGRDEQYRYVGDFDFWLRVALHGPFARIPRTLATFRVHGGSASTAHRSLRMADEHIILMDNYYQRKDLPPAAFRLKREAYSSAYYIAAVQCLTSNRKVAAQYFIKSLLLHGGSRPNGLDRSMELILKTIFDDPPWLRKLSATFNKR